MLTNIPISEDTMLDQSNTLTVQLVTYDQSARPSRIECREIVEYFAQPFVRNKSPRLVFDNLGKPSIANAKQLHVSYAHSSKMLAIVYSVHNIEAGIDTEPLERTNEIASLKEQAFSAQEISKIQQNSEWAMAWCLKEAAMKQIGTGFRSIDPNQITITTIDDSYTLYADDKIVNTGHWYKILNSTMDSTIVVSTNKVIDKVELTECAINTYYNRGGKA